MTQESLFICDKTYVADTSALIRLEATFKQDNVIFTAVWEEVEDLIKKGCFKIIDYVETEINGYEGKEVTLKNWVKKWKKFLVAETDAASFNAARPIINEEYGTGFFDAKKLATGKEEADSYLIAYCMVHKCILLTNENKFKPNKIPAVAEKNGVYCIDILEFLEDRGLRMIRNI